MSEPRLKSKLMVHALLRRCQMQAVPATIASKGDEDAGTVLVRVYLGNGHSRIYNQTRDLSGRLGWTQACGEVPVEDQRADDYIRHAKDVDWDLWVIDIDSPNGHVPFIHDPQMF